MNKIIKRLLENIILLLILIALILVSCFMMKSNISYAADDEDSSLDTEEETEHIDLESLSVEEKSNYESLLENLNNLKGLDWSYSSTKIKPIDGDQVNKHADVFCAEKDIAYAKTANLYTFKGNYTTFYGSASTGWGDFRQSSIIKPTIGTTVSTDYKQMGTSLGTRVSRSSFYYETFSQSYTGGFAFILARYKQTDPDNHRADPLQWAVWSYLGDTDKNPYRAAEEQYNNYYKAATKNPNINVTVAENVGTIIVDGNSYKIGPFTMSNYVRAKDYKYDEPINFTWAGENDKNNISWKTNSTNLQKTFGSDSNLQGTIIRAVAKFSNGFTYDIDVPEPGETFYITVPISEVENADKLESITFTYQVVEATGYGTLYEGHQWLVTWEETGSSEESNCTYYCTQQNEGYGSHSTSNYGGYQLCTYTYNCNQHYVGCGCNKYNHRTCGQTEEHVHSDSCYDENGRNTCHKDGHTHSSDCYNVNGVLTCGHKDHTHSDICYTAQPNCHCACTGHSDTHWSTFKCVHGNTDCYTTSWEITDYTDVAQDVLEAYGFLSSNKKDYTIALDIPLTTDVSIYKYITKVEHSNGKVIFEGTSRRNMKMSDKETDTLKVERGDKITYTIEFVNDSKFDVRVKVKDTLPSSISDANVHSDIKNSNWITVPKNNSVRYTITLIADGTEGNFTNYIKFITTNDTDPTIQYAEEFVGNNNNKHRYGAIVNKSNKLEDSDTYTIKEYQVNINKHITKVVHTTNLEQTYDSSASTVSNFKTNESSSTRVNRTDSSNLSDPVYVEYGDRVYYEIQVYNTNKKDYLGTTNSAKPYYSPDLIHVNITDILPAKYSGLTVEVTGALNSPTINTSNVGKFTISDIQVPANSYATIKVSLVVEESTAGTVCGNTATITGNITNINKKDIKNNESSARTSSTDYYKLNDYNINIDKYISSYDGSVMNVNNSQGLTNETSSIGTSESVERRGKTDSEKENNPFQAEKTETLTYSIRLQNLSTKSGNKPATRVRTTEITETLQQGLSFQTVTAKIYKSDGSVKIDNLPVVATNKGNNVYVLSISDKQGNIYTTLDPGEYIIYYVKVKITESNMYLYNLTNTATIATLTNINDNGTKNRVVTSANKATQKISKDYVKLKDLVISGKVWVDTNKDGYISSGENKLEGIVVKLYNAKTDTVVSTVTTNSTGTYTFGRVYKASTKVDNSNVVGTINSSENSKNYKAGTSLNEYYIEFEYDGLMYKSTEIYSNTSHISESWLPSSDSGNYKNDSNAYEFKDVREAFNKNFETIGYNIGYAENANKNSGSSTQIAYSKTDHETTMLEDRTRVITARSFITAKDKNKSDGTSNNTNSLWLYSLNSQNYSLSETEYLKYINLGLEEREDIDISIKKDVSQVITTVNGEQVTYDFDQDSNGNYTISDPYTLNLYESDYKYRIEQYKNQKVQEYKGENSELNIEVIFKIAITNESIRDNEPNRTNKDIPIDVTIDELADYYDSNFKKYDDSSNEYTVKVKDGDYLTDKTVKIAEAWYNTSGSPSDKVRDLSLSNTSSYNSERTFDGYNTLYISGFDDIKIGEGSTGYVFVKYTIEKQNTITQEEQDLINDTTSGNLLRYLSIFDQKDDSSYDNTGDHYGIIEGISEINAYSTWYGAVSAEYKQENPSYVENAPAGLVDRDSNPGDLGDSNSSKSTEASRSEKADNSGLYEDDTYRTAIKFGVNTISTITTDADPTPELSSTPNADPDVEVNTNAETAYRKLTGFVWDDARTETINSDSEGNQYIGDGYYDTSKTKISEAKSNSNVLTLLETNGLTTYKSLVKEFNNPEAENKDFAIKDVKAEIIEIVRIPDSNGTIRYYEETIDAAWPSIQSTRTNSSGQYELTGFIPGYYIVRFTYGDKETAEMLTYNGQDYKSTTYTAGIENSTYTSSSNSQIENYDKVMEALESANKSDARDDEISRLKSISYSEIMTNEKADTLKGISIYGEDESEITNRQTTLVENTAMNAETVTFYVKPEKLDSIDINVTDTQNSQSAIANASTYASRTNIPYDMIESRTYTIQNIDLGLQYRPESNIELDKEIKSINIITSNNESLIKVVFKDLVDSSGNIVLNAVTNRAERTIDTENSINLNNIQFICNNNKSQGFVYINVDQEILQGATIVIEYEFTVENTSETDRISTNLDNLRYKDNTNNSIVNSANISNNVIERYFGESTAQPIVDENNYLASDTAQKYLYSKTFTRDLNYANDDDYRIIEKTMTTGNDNYYGQYLGGVYYTGSTLSTDTVADIKIDKILDYVDTELTFKESSNDTTDYKWTSTTSEALLKGDSVNGSLIRKELFKNVDGNTNNTGSLKLVNMKGIAYDTALSSNLAISIDDRTSDTDNDVINTGISKFLSPKTVGNTNTNEYKGNITLQAEKVISAEEDSENLSFENIAEIIQFTSTSGRRTNFATTIGNAFWNSTTNNKTTETEYLASLYENDTSATEVITLSPPTGLNRIQNAIRNTVDTTSNVVIVVSIILIVIAASGVVTKVIIKRYNNRRIK